MTNPVIRWPFLNGDNQACEGIFKVYNFEVAETHTYDVGPAGVLGIWTPLICPPVQYLPGNPIP